MAPTDSFHCVPGVSYCCVEDLLKQTEERLDSHIRFSVKQAKLRAAMQPHIAPCASNADSAAPARVPDVQANRVKRLRERCIANDDQAEALNVAMLLETEEHDLEMARLNARIIELENEYLPWKAKMDKADLLPGEFCRTLH